MPTADTLELVDRISALEATFAAEFRNTNRQLEELRGEVKILTEAYNQAKGIKWSVMAIAGVVGFAASYGAKIALAVLGMIK